MGLGESNQTSLAIDVGKWLNQKECMERWPKCNSHRPGIQIKREKKPLPRKVMLMRQFGTSKPLPSKRKVWNPKEFAINEFVEQTPKRKTHIATTQHVDTNVAQNRSPKRNRKHDDSMGTGLLTLDSSSDSPDVVGDGSGREGGGCGLAR